MDVAFLDISPVRMTGDPDRETPAFRDPFRHPALRGSGFEDQFDYSTVFFDIFDAGQGGAMALSPPLGRYVRSHNLQVMTEHGPCEMIHLRRKRLDMLHFPGLAPASAVTVKSDLFEQSAMVSASAADLFQDRRALLFINKNNALQWIYDFVLFYVKKHGCDAVCVYDNGSTEYSLAALADCIAMVPGLSAVAVTSWPFKWGVMDGNYDSAYTQRAFLEHARWRCLRHARSVVQCDVDELIFARQGTVFEAVERSDTGYISFDGHWVYAERAEHHRILGEPRHHHFISTDRSLLGRCRKKWACVPHRISSENQWMVHNILGAERHDDAAANTLELRHFMGINTGWKQPGRSTPQYSAVAQEEALLVRELVPVLQDVYPAFSVQPDKLQTAALLMLNGAIPTATQTNLLEELELHAQHMPWLAMLVAPFLEDKGLERRAAKLYRAALDIEPGLHEASYRLSRLEERAGRMDSAAQFARKAAELQSDNLQYFRRLTVFLNRGADEDLALRIARDLRSAYPKDTQVCIAVARALSKLGRLEEALASIENICAPDSDIPIKDRIFIAETYKKLEMWGVAAEQAEAILTESPGWPWLHHLRSLCLEKTGRLADALLAEQAAFDLLPTSPGIQNRLQDLRAATENLQAQEPD